MPRNICCGLDWFSIFWFELVRCLFVCLFAFLGISQSREGKIKLGFEDRAYLNHQSIDVNRLFALL